MTRSSKNPRWSERRVPNPRTRRGLAYVARTSAATSLLAGLAFGQLQLTNAVPDDAFFAIHTKSTPEADFIQKQTQKVFDAVIEADFGGMVMNDVLPEVLGKDDLATARSAYRLVEDLVGAVPWMELAEDEVVFAMRQYGASSLQAFGSNTDRQILVAVDVDDSALRSKAFSSLTRILATAQQVSEGKVQLEVTVETGDAQRILGGAEALDEAQGHLGTSAAVCCDLAVPIDLGDGRGWKNHTLVSLMFVEDKLLLGAMPYADALTRDALDAMRGRNVGRLVETERYREAFARVPEGFSEVYFDMSAMLEPMKETLELVMQGRSVDTKMMEFQPELALFTEGVGLADFLGSAAVTTRVEDNLAITDSVMTFNEDSDFENNPFYKMMTNTVETEGDLLDLVPSDAASFSMNGGVDLVPLYDWTLERVGKLIPDAEARYIPMFNAVQAVVGVDLREDLLPLIGSPSLMITLPGRAAHSPADTVMVAMPANLDASRDLEKRLVKVGESLLPVLRAELAPQLRQSGARFDIALAPNDGAYRMLHKLTVEGGFGPFGQKTDFLFGHVGPLQIMSTSEDAIAKVLETYAGEYPTIREEGILVDLGSVPPGNATSVSMVDTGATIQAASMGIQQAGSMIQMMSADLQKHDREARAISSSTAGMLQRMGSIYRAMDFLGHSITSTHVSEEGDAIFGRYVTEYRID